MYQDDIDTLKRIDEKAQDINRLFALFREQQTELGGEVTTGDKQELKKRLKALDDELNRYLASEYGISQSNFKGKQTYEKKYSEWLTSHKPFHWFIEFHAIMKEGGFDVIIGNPPYVEYSKVKKEYTVHGYQTEDCGNLYAYVLERSFELSFANGRCGLIVPLSLVATERMNSLQSMIAKSQCSIWLSFYDVYPCKLFEGAKQRLTIILTSGKLKQAKIFTTKYYRWKVDERDSLFQRIFYWCSYFDKGLSIVFKLHDKITENILQKLMEKETALYINNISYISFYVHRIPYNFVKALDFIPYFWNSTDGQKKSEDYKPYCLKENQDERIVLAMINSNLFFW